MNLHQSSTFCAIISDKLSCFYISKVRYKNQSKNTGDSDKRRVTTVLAMAAVLPTNFANVNKPLQ
jgi:hypothetical protein